MVVSALAERGEAGRAALVTALQQDEADVRQAAAEVLKRSGRDLAPVVASQLVAAKPAAQADMLRLLAHHRDERAVEPAAALLRSSPDMVVRRLAVETLAACEAPAVWGPAVADALEKDIAVEVQQAAATALGRARWTDAVPALIAELDTPHRELRRLTVLALGQMRDPRALTPLSNLYQAKALKTDDDPSLRENIVESIARIGGEGSVPVLMAAATDRDVRVRYTARDALR
jgi:HEAT repeat protein